ncbi:glycosyltransferase [Jannaschia ovalis]|uniref:Glycosyltransferase n=1 Tax=Jannaschia ovalis TaxID=3038773 RepID=A0ABY8LHT3_9RHOB|nr:glycosyltransferase [Jannaschia sp. GRR-S6-38]WGH80222.1 glycosyltransferase [Jannaschia sp. GRR-S6-38]
MGQEWWRRLVWLWSCEGGTVTLETVSPQIIRKERAISGDATPVLILMCTRNGEAFLQPQLDSIAAQDHRDWRLWVADDGSTDGTVRLLHRFARRHRGRHAVRVLPGPCLGATTNFLTLLCHPELPLGPEMHVALSDQDDVWYPDKLSRALRRLAEWDGPRPVIYGAAAVHGPGGRTGRRPRNPSDLRRAFVENPIAGHSMVLPPETMRLVRAAGPPPGVPFHDWWLSLLVLAAGGRAILDPVPALDYRQHDGNLMGSPSGPGAALRRLARLTDGTFGRWIAANCAALIARRTLITDEALTLARSLAADRGAGSLMRNRIRRQGLGGTAALYTAAAAGRLR